MQTQEGFVLDCSVTMAWCFDDEATPYTDGVRDSLADITLARTVLGYEPVVDLPTGLVPTVEYYQQAGF